MLLEACLKHIRGKPVQWQLPIFLLQSNLVKQLGKLVKVRYVEDITRLKRVGTFLPGFKISQQVTVTGQLPGLKLLFLPGARTHRTLPAAPATLS